MFENNCPRIAAFEIILQFIYLFFFLDNSIDLRFLVFNYMRNSVHILKPNNVMNHVDYSNSVANSKNRSKCLSLEI